MAERLIDFHTHAHPSAPEGIAFQEVLLNRPNPVRTGGPEELLGIMDRADIAMTLMVPWLPGRDMVQERVAAGESAAAATREVVDRWFQFNADAVKTVMRTNGRIQCLVGLDPLLMHEEEMRTEVMRRLRAGACGLKIAPTYIGAPPNDPRMMQVFALAQEFGVWVLSEVVADVAGGTAWGHPKNFHEVLQTFPDVDVMLAHLGRGAEDEVARLTATYPNIFADTSMRLDDLGRPGEWTMDDMVSCMRAIGTDRVIFGTNYPLCDPAEYAEVIRSFPLTEQERSQIMHENAEGILRRSEERKR